MCCEVFRKTYTFPNMIVIQDKDDKTKSKAYLGGKPFDWIVLEPVEKKTYL